MRELLHNHTGLVLSCVLGSIALVIMFSGVFKSSDGTETTGIMATMGQEAMVKDTDLTASRKGIEMEGVADASRIKIKQKGVLKVGTQTDMDTLFEATEDGNTLSYKVLYIYDKDGNDILATPVAAISGNSLTINAKGTYMFVARINSKGSTTKSFNIMVSE